MPYIDAVPWFKFLIAPLCSPVKGKHSGNSELSFDMLSAMQAWFVEFSSPRIASKAPHGASSLFTTKTRGKFKKYHINET